MGLTSLSNRFFTHLLILFIWWNTIAAVFDIFKLSIFSFMLIFNKKSEFFEV